VYSWIWRHLPGDTGSKALLSLLLVLVAIGLLFFVVFPWLDLRLPATSVTVGS
jgi:hypothetical protein